MGWSKPWPVKTQVGKKKTFVLKSDDNFNAAIINHGIKEILLIGGASMAQKKKKKAYCHGTSPTSILSPSLSSYTRVYSPLPSNKPVITPSPLFCIPPPLEVSP